MSVNRFAFEHELSSKTKGNSQREMPSRAEVLQAGELHIAESSKRMLEIEYGYAKDNAILAINQRSEMMRVYLAILGILAGAAFALIREGKAKELDLDVIFCMALFAAASSLYYMRGLVILRSDWRDYLEVMARIKVCFIRIEQQAHREFVLDRALYHDPFRLPSKNLKTNFFYHSFILCVLSLICALVAAAGIFAYLAFPSMIARGHGMVSLGALAAIFVGVASLAVWLAGTIWDTTLEEERFKAPSGGTTE